MITFIYKKYFLFCLFFNQKELKKENLELRSQINVLEKKIIFEKEQVVVSISTISTNIQNVIQYVCEYKYIKLNNKYLIYLFKL